MSNPKSRDIHAKRMLTHLAHVLEDRAESAGEPTFSGISGATQMNLLLDVLLTDTWEMAARKVALATAAARPDITVTSAHMQQFQQENWSRNRFRCQHFVRRLHGDESGLDLLWLMLAAAPAKPWTYVGWIGRLTAAVNQMADQLTAIEEGLLTRALERYQRWTELAGGFPAVEDDPFAAVTDRGWRRSEAAQKDRERADRASAAIAAEAAERRAAAERAHGTRTSAVRQPFKSIRELATADEDDVAEPAGAVWTAQEQDSGFPSVQVLAIDARVTGTEYRRLTDQRTALRITPDLREMRDILRAEYPHAHAAIDLLLLDLRPGEPISFRPFMLVGAPGCGKSRLIRRLCEPDLLDVRLRRSDGAGSSDNAFGGAPRRWSNASPCVPLQAIAQFQIASPVLLIDEIDKSGSSTAGSLANALMPLLERETSAAYPDPCHETEADLSHVNYALTANDDSRLPSPLRDRLRIIRVPSPGPEHIESLSRSILKDLAAELNVPAAFMLPLAPDELSVVAQAWGDNGSVRRLQKIVRGTVTARDQHAVRH
jgi:hypothetical protein